MINTEHSQTLNVAKSHYHAFQIDEEMMTLMGLLLLHKPRHVLEIGTLNGGLFYLLCKIASPDGIKIAIDLNDTGLYPTQTEMDTWAKNVHRLQVNSHDPATLHLVKSILGPNKLDFLFIDGDHTMRGVTADYEMYSTLMSPNGYIGFHDIVHMDTRVFWNNLDVSNKFTILKTNANWAGIGLIPAKSVGISHDPTIVPTTPNKKFNFIKLK